LKYPLTAPEEGNGVKKPDAAIKPDGPPVTEQLATAYGTSTRVVEISIISPDFPWAGVGVVVIVRLPACARGIVTEDIEMESSIAEVSSNARYRELAR